MDKVKDAKTKKATSKKKPKNNAKNLVPNSERTPSELRAITQKGGIASGKARREKRDRQEQVLMILDLAVKNPEIMEKLDKLGVEDKKRTIETAMDASVVNRVLETGDPTAYKAIKEEAYGKMESHDKLDINAEVKSINITLRNYGG